MHFDQAAATWDDSPVRRERAQALAETLRPIIRQHQYRNALDYGAGTGAVSFLLAGELRHILLADLSEGMVRKAMENITESGLANLEARRLDLLMTPFDEPPFDLIYTLMTLHHIRDIRGILERFYALLRPGGCCCIADLESEDGSFHAEFPDFDGHNGFAPDALALQMEAVGFTDINYHRFFTIARPLPDGGEKAYPLFFMQGAKGIL